MTPEEINRRIAEACGWKLYLPTPESISRGYPKFKYWIEPKESPTFKSNFRSGYLPEPPNYHGDLNAMHEAELTLSIDQQYNYGEELRKITGNTGPRGGHFTPNGWGCFSMATATSAQRAKAFISTITQNISQ